MHYPTLAVAKHLHFYVTAAGNEALQVDTRVTEGGTGFGGCQLNGGFEVFRAIDTLHATATAAANGFDQKGGADVLRELDSHVDVGDCTAGHNRNVCRLRGLARA